MNYLCPYLHMLFNINSHVLQILPNNYKSEAILVTIFAKDDNIYHWRKSLSRC
jgi:hypothetical protein